MRAPLEARWLAGDEEAARALAAGMTAVELRRFGTEALAACCENVKAPQEVLEVVDSGRNDPNRGHAAFDAVRQLTLRAEARGDVSATPLLYAAENVARIVYNSTAPDDPFDADAEEYVFSSIAAFHTSLPPQVRETLAQQLRRVLETTRPTATTAAAARTIQLAKLKSRWLVGEPEACSALAQEMTASQLRLFAVDALAACCTATAKVPPAVVQVLDAGCSAPSSTRIAFDVVRELRLAAESTQGVTLDARLLRVAESAARVIYNSTGPDDAFDPASGEWLFQVSASFLYAAPDGVREQLGQRLLHALAKATTPSDVSA